MALDESDSISLTAFIVSLVALIVSFLQFTQSTFLTAEGSRRCKPSVIGKWSKLAHKHFIWSELRFEMTFTTPKLILVDFSDPYSHAFFIEMLAEVSGRNDVYDKVQLLHQPDVQVHPRSRQLRAAAHVLSWNSLPYGIEDCWKRNRQTKTRSTEWQWLQTVGERFKKLLNMAFFFMEDFHEAGTSQEIGITWDSLLRQIYLYQTCSYGIRHIDNQFIDALAEHTARLESGVHQNDLSSTLQSGFASRELSSKTWDGSGTNAAIVLQRHTWDLMPPDAIRPMAQAELGAILVFAQRLGMRWREIDLFRGSLRAEGDGCSITSNSIQGFGIVLQFNQSRKFRPVQMINNQKVDKLMCGIVPGCKTLGLNDIEVVSDVRDVNTTHRRWLHGLGFGGYVDDTRKHRPYWSQTLLNDAMAFYCPFLPSKGNPATRAPNPFGFDAVGLVATTEYADAVQLLRVKLRERQKTGTQWSPNSRPHELMTQLHDKCEDDFYHRADAVRHRDLISLEQFDTSSKSYRALHRLAERKLDLVAKLQDIHGETTHYFAVLQRSDDKTQADASSSYLHEKNQASPNGKLRYIDLFRAHIRMQADAIWGHDDVINTRIDSIRNRITAGGDYKNAKQIDNPIVAIVDQFDPANICRKLRDGRAYTEEDISDEQIEEAWWMLIVRGISWRMSVELAGPPFCTVAPASLYGSDMPVWLT